MGSHLEPELAQDRPARSITVILISLLISASSFLRENHKLALTSRTRNGNGNYLLRENTGRRERISECRREVPINAHMDERTALDISKRLSYVLRHRPDSIGLQLDETGWASVAELLEKLAHQGVTVTRGDLETVVAENDKKRFAFSTDGSRIRASQGHSVAVDLGYEPASPPDTLFHGTASRFVESIHREGLMRGSRAHVHLSIDHETAIRVGRRHGNPVVFVVEAQRLSAAGHLFYLSDNGVWLTEHVPVPYLTLASSDNV
jgi:putative RNA 2'-phosphotransferase